MSRLAPLGGLNLESAKCLQPPKDASCCSVSFSFPLLTGFCWPLFTQLFQIGDSLLWRHFHERLAIYAWNLLFGLLLTFIFGPLFISHAGDFIVVCFPFSSGSRRLFSAS